MKKIFILLFLLLLTGCTSSTVEYVSKSTFVNLDKCVELTKINNHGGFLGDGELFIKLDCSENPISIKPNEWNELPISNGLEEATKLNICDDKGCLDLYERYNIPKDITGYYFFFDRHTDAVDRYSDLDLNNRASYNYTFALYDSINKIIYFYELDT